MKLTLPENSLFAILLRSRWWVSLLVALGAFGVVRLFLDEGFAFFAALPFTVIAGMALVETAPCAERRGRSMGSDPLKRAVNSLG